MTQIGPQTSVKSETVFSGKLLDVRRDTVSLGEDKTAQMEIVVHPEVIAVLPVLPDGSLLLVRQYRKAVESILLELPAGGIEDGETPEEAVCREMVEETGYRVGAMRKLVSFYISPGYTTEKMHLFVAEDLSAGSPTEETDEIEVVQMRLEELLPKIHRGELQDAKTILGLLLYAEEQSEATHPTH